MQLAYSKSASSDDGDSGGRFATDTQPGPERERKRRRVSKCRTYAGNKRRRVGIRSSGWGYRRNFTSYPNSGVKRKAADQEGGPSEAKRRKACRHSVKTTRDEGQTGEDSEGGNPYTQRQAGTSGTNTSSNTVAEIVHEGGPDNQRTDESSQEDGGNSGHDNCTELDRVYRPLRQYGPGEFDGPDLSDRQTENQVLKEYCEFMANDVRTNGKHGFGLTFVQETATVDTTRLIREGSGEDRYHLVSDVLYPRDGAGEITEYIRQLLQDHKDTRTAIRNDRTYSPVIVSIHVTSGFIHVHLLHVCSSSNRGCRDWVAKHIKRQKASGRCIGHFRKYFRNRQTQDVLAFAHYLCQEDERRRCFILYGGGLQSPFRGFKVLQSGGRGRFRDDEHVALSIVPNEDVVRARQQVGHGDQNGTAGGSGGAKGASRRSNYALLKEIEEKLLNIGAEPIDQGMRTVYWLEDELFGSLDRNSTLVKNALTLIETRLASFKILDYIKMYNSGKYVPIFGARSREEYSDHYYPCATSAKIIFHTLLFQCNNDKSELHAFLLFLTDWFDRKTKKKNTLVVIGEPSAGKNYIFDSLKSWSQSCGIITDLSKSSKFGLQDAINKRMAFWNEAVIDPAFEEKLLDFLGGTETKVDVKFHPSTVLKRVPVLITANYDSIPKSARFDSRCQRVRRWKYFPYLETLDKLIDPLAWNYVFNLVLGRVFDFPDMCLRHYLP